MWHAKPYNKLHPEVWLPLWHMAPFWGCMQVEKPCLPNAAHVLASQCLKFRGCFSFIVCPTYYVLTAQHQVPEVRINVIYACTLWSFYRARLKENELHKLYRKEQLYLTCLTPPAATVPEGAPPCLGEGGKGHPKYRNKTELINTPMLKLSLPLLSYQSQDT